MRKICIMGAESTGTTTLAKELAYTYGAIYVPEYGRIHAEMITDSHRWKPMDFLQIARVQNTLEKNAQRLGNEMIVCDTDSWSTLIWAKRYLGYTPSSLRQIALRSIRADVVIFTGDDIPFVQDGTRDGSVELRRQMQEELMVLMRSQGYYVQTVYGEPETRLASACELIDADDL